MTPNMQTRFYNCFSRTHNFSSLFVNHKTLVQTQSHNLQSWSWLRLSLSHRMISISSQVKQKYIPRRALMYVPGHNPKMLSKIPSLGVDCAVLECEDGVAVNMKAEARKNCKVALKELKSKNGLDIALRVNSVSSGLVEEDLNAIIGCGLGPAVAAINLPQTILVPKVDTVDDLNIFTEALAAVKQDKKYNPLLVFFTESAEGLMNLKDILHQAKRYSEQGHYAVDGIVFGSDDYCASVGAERSKEGSEVIYARQKVVAMAKAFQLQAIDMVYIDIKDTDGLRASCQAGSAMGFTGKQVIHPSQVAIVQDSFSPSSQRVEWATQLIEAFEQHQQHGQGAFVFRGQMIDRPSLLQAKNVIKIASTGHQ